MPVEGGLFKQYNGKASVFFIYHLASDKDHTVKLEVSSTFDMKNIVMERTISRHRTNWTSTLSGKFFWHFILLDGQGKVLETTPTRTFLIAPNKVDLAIEGGNSFTFETKNPTVTFHWGQKSPNIKPLFFRFKICKDAKFDDTLVNADLHDLSYTTNQLGSGYYYSKVGVKWTEELPIQYSDIKVFTIAQHAKPPSPVLIEQPQSTPDKTAGTQTEEQKTTKAPILEASKASKADSKTTPATTEAPQKEVNTSKKAPSPIKVGDASFSHAKQPKPPETDPNPKIAIIAPKIQTKREKPKPLAAPQLFAPMNKTALETFDELVAIDLEWKSPGRARQFLVEISPSESFDPREQLVTEEKSLVVKKPKGTYYWRVLAVDELGIRSAFSAPWLFTIEKPVIKLGLLAPRDKVEESYTKRLPLMVFSWKVNSKQVKPIGYKLEIATDAYFEEKSFSSDTKETSVSTDSIKDGSYFWRVGAIFRTDDPPILSAKRSFTIVKRLEPLEPPTPAAPTDQFSAESYGEMTPVSFLWDAPERAVSFEISLADDPTFHHPMVKNTLDKRITLPLNCGTFYWRLKGVDKNGTESPYSPTRLVKVVKSDKTITLNSPGNKAKISAFKVAFSWDKLKECGAYEVIISTDVSLEKPGKLQKTNDNTLQIEMDDEDKYYWMVQCPLAEGRLIKSAIQSFVIVGDK